MSFVEVPLSNAVVARSNASYSNGQLVGANVARRGHVHGIPSQITESKVVKDLSVFAGGSWSSPMASKAVEAYKSRTAAYQDQAGNDMVIKQTEGKP